MPYRGFTYVILYMFHLGSTVGPDRHFSIYHDRARMEMSGVGEVKVLEPRGNLHTPSDHVHRLIVAKAVFLRTNLETTGIGNIEMRTALLCLLHSADRPSVLTSV